MSSSARVKSNNMNGFLEYVFFSAPCDFNAQRHGRIILM